MTGIRGSRHGASICTQSQAQHAFEASACKGVTQLAGAGRLPLQGTSRTLTTSLQLVLKMAMSVSASCGFWALVRKVCASAMSYTVATTDM